MMNLAGARSWLYNFPISLSFYLHVSLGSKEWVLKLVYPLTYFKSPLQKSFFNPTLPLPILNT